MAENENQEEWISPDEQQLREWMEDLANVIRTKTKNPNPIIGKNFRTEISNIIINEVDLQESLNKTY